jgi:N-acetylglucosamine-6-phosphate deacetylase
MRNQRNFRGREASTDAIRDFCVVDGRIHAIEAASDPMVAGGFGGAEIFISPGFIDLQLNGYDGIDFNEPRTPPEQIAASARLVRRTGVTTFCPTVITGSFDHIAGCIANIIAARDQSPEFARAAPAIHLEGPFISTEDGPRGAHPREHARPPDWEEFVRWQDLARGGIRILTLSPEYPGSLEFIEHAAQSGVVVAIGHTAATPAQIRDAVGAGATMSTHLGNGSHAKIDRHPNYIWEQLAADELWASFIVDGHHLPPPVVKCFLRAKRVQRSVLVTDAIAAAGKPAGRYTLGNVEVDVTPERRVCLPGTPYLAGSVLEMHDAIGKTVEYSDLELHEALLMATFNPARLLGLSDQRGTLDIGADADFVLFDWSEGNSTIGVVATVVRGEVQAQ